VITGDLSVTSHPKEFSEAALFVQNLRSLGLETFVIPGNHDHYTRSAFKSRLFYDFFPNDWLKDHLVMKQQIAANWWFVGLDTALATSWISSRGEFSEEIEERLISILDEIPDHHFVIMANHFPFFQNESPRKVLSRGNDLKHILSKHPKVKFYLHGHTHRHCIADLRSSNLPIIIDSGSTPKGDTGAWNLISLEPNRCSVDVFRFNETWKPSQKVELTL
jgi:3',5'-cyclic AMP phosphodiesterase CpdA